MKHWLTREVSPLSVVVVMSIVVLVIAGIGWKKAVSAGASSSAPGANPRHLERAAPVALQVPDDLPGLRKVLDAPDRIPAIDDPHFVSAAQANLPPERRVLALAGQREQKAYSLWLLNRHEIVNDTLDGLPIVSTW